MLESLSKGIYKEEKSISNVICLVHSICLYFHRCPRIYSILANALGLLLHFYGCCLLRVLVVFRLFKGGGVDGQQSTQWHLIHLKLSNMVT